MIILPRFKNIISVPSRDFLLLITDPKLILFFEFEVELSECLVERDLLHVMVSGPAKPASWQLVAKKGMLQGWSQRVPEN